MNEYVLENKYLLKLDLQFFADGPGGEKTEQPTSKKLDDARKKGQVAKSREITNAISLVALFLILRVYLSYMGADFIELFSNIYKRIPDYAHYNEFQSISIMAFFRSAILSSLKITIPFLLASVIVGFIVNIVMVKWKVSFEPMKPKFSKLNPINGFKRIFSKDALFELVKSILKVGLILIVVYFTLKGKLNELFLLYNIPLWSAVAEVGSIVVDVGFKISLVYCIIGIADLVFQKRKFMNDMKMTKQEVKDEMKNTEGSPEIKGRQRSVMREASRKRMMNSVPEADVVITNPTHFAVAIKYDLETAPAPFVVAKGQDFMAQRIKEIAKDNNVQIVEDKPLARMLFANVEVGQQIPEDLYEAVASILAMVYRANGKI